MDLFRDGTPVKARIYISAVILAGSLVLADSLFQAFTANPLTWLFLAAITAMGSFAPIGIPYARGNKGQSITITVSDVFIFVSILIYSPEVAVCLSLVDGCLGSIKVKKLYRIAFNLGQVSLVASGIGHLFYIIQGQHPPLSSTNIHNVPMLFLNLGLCAFFYFLLNTGSIAFAMSLVTGNRFLEVWRQNFLWAWVTNLAGALAAAVIFLNFESMRYMAIGMAIPVIIVIYHAYRMNHQRILMSQQSRRFQSTLDALSSNIALLDDSGNIITVNAAWQQSAAFRQQYGKNLDVGVNYLDCLEGQISVKFKESTELASGLREVLDSQRTDYYQECFLRDSEDQPWWAIRVTRFTGDGQGRVVVAEEDITARKRAEEALRHSEEQLRHTQKLEAVGKLAGGIAHDFRNLLMVILGYSDLISGETPVGNELHDAADEITKAAKSASELTSQLLAFSRKDMVQPRVVDLNGALQGMEKILQRLVGEDISLVTIFHPDLWRVKIDPGQLEQIAVNLAVNSRDAMPAGGKLIIETENVEIDSSSEHAVSGLKPGAYVMLAVSDTGRGMDQATLARVFEPFFTTKEVGKGTGLGLSTVYGIVNQCGGQVFAYSELSFGTIFKVYLPRFCETPELESKGKKCGAAPHGSETVMLVDDEPSARQIARAMLERNGYSVLEASQGKEALKISENHPGPIHLMVTDVVMPQMKGYELAEFLAPLRPDMKVLYVSGYTENGVSHQTALAPQTAFLHKPFTFSGLAHKVRDLLDA